MSIQKQVVRDIDRIEPGKMFTYQALPAWRSSPESTAKAMSLLVSRGQVRRFSKGVFYRPKQGVLGEVRPSDNEKIRLYLFAGEKRIGYITGLSLYNRMGLTTQVPKTVTIATEKARQKKSLGNIDIRLVPSKAPVNEQNKEYLEVLDALTDIKNIPDSQPFEVLDVLSQKIKNMDEGALNSLVQLAKGYYPPATKALLGLILDTNGYAISRLLAEELNPTTRYNIGLKGFWSQAKKWKII
ncbi:hypothetical protein G3755_002157 [Salmonella enterica]|nr:hypothetical protein [Salmonella enterica]EBG0125272.1 hypothetical protein [Salmonella enterica subsp. enterica serovar Newport]EEL3740586.1 hypothetical protein [Salmonella enterica subsp. enterica serovar Enteritidis]EBX6375261.1 hypothetical protein [Salmonella enterica subsp. enterica serovar Newport]ECG2760149.1 hypothetical protein [Salmonella enterica subsp. enterica serovar Newport]